MAEDSETIGYIPRGGRDYRARFWSFVEPRNGCWEWTGGVRRGGYGAFGYVTARNQVRQIGAHRLSWEMLYGAIPDGLHVCHSCDNPRCVRPSHLWLGTDYDNAWDKMRKGRDNLAVRVWPVYQRANTKLSMSDADDIRRRVAQGEQQNQLASEYGVSIALVSLIILGKRWVRNG